MPTQWWEEATLPQLLGLFGGRLQLLGLFGGRLQLLGLFGVLPRLATRQHLFGAPLLHEIHPRHRLQPMAPRLHLLESAVAQKDIQDGFPGLIVVSTICVTVVLSSV